MNLARSPESTKTRLPSLTCENFRLFSHVRIVWGDTPVRSATASTLNSFDISLTF